MLVKMFENAAENDRRLIVEASDRDDPVRHGRSADLRLWIYESACRRVWSEFEGDVVVVVIGPSAFDLGGANDPSSVKLQLKLVRAATEGDFLKVLLAHAAGQAFPEQGERIFSPSRRVLQIG